ncbi:MAG: hypothetical protein Ta2A_15020 [Treponemataceae bacterium]|nr:MAG: hypothetical protein Ta2A_15020 [Treponemataceae bacterium]
METKNIENNADFRFCPKCGKKGAITYVNERHWVCAECGFDLYNNVASAVGIIIADTDGKILFVKRGKNPRKGFLAFPGGFTDPGENAEDAARRETFEETGLVLDAVTYICSFPNTYPFNGMVYATCDSFFAGIPESSKTPLLERLSHDDEIAGYELCAVDSPEAIARIPLAFPSALRALEKYHLMKKEKVMANLTS